MGIADTWTATTSGNWTDAANWSGGVPGPSSDAFFPGTIALTAAYDASSTIDQILGGTNQTLAITGGTLALVQGGNWTGTIDTAGGTLNVLNNTLTVEDLTVAAGASALVQQGAALSVTGGGTLAGFLGGSGEVSLDDSGMFALAAGLGLSDNGTLQLTTSATTVSLGADLTDNGVFILGGGATLALGGHTLTLNGPDLLNALATGPGTIAAANAVLIGQELLGGAVLQDTGTLVQDNFISMGSSTADTSGLNIDAGATYDMAGGYEIAANGTATIANAGLFVKTASTDEGFIQADFDNTGNLVVDYGTLFLTGTAASTGSISIDGVLSLGGGGSLSGAISGPGELDLSNQGTQHTYTLGGAVDVGTLELDIGALVTLEAAPTITAGFTLGNSSTLALNGKTLTAPQALLQGELLGPGTVTVDNAAIANTFVLSGGAVLVDAGTVALDGNTELGTGSADSATLQVAAGATLDAPTDTSMTANGTASIDNAGLIRKTGFSSTSTLAGSLDNTGTIAVDAGTLALSGGDSTLGGIISGAGELDLRGGGTFALQNTLSLTPGALSILDGNTQVNLSADRSYLGAFTLGTGATLGLGGHNFTLSDPATLSGTVSGPGTVIASNPSIAGLTLLGGATLQDGDVALQTAQLNMGIGTADISGVTIGAGDTYDILGGGNVIAHGSASITNSGLFEKTGNDDSIEVQAVLGSTGTVAIDAGTLGLDGGGALAGTITGAGELDLRGGGTYTLPPAVAITVGTLALYDGGTMLQASAGGTVTGSFTFGPSAVLSGNGVTLDGPFALNGTLETGLLVAAGTGELGGMTVNDNGTLDVTGAVAQDFFLQLGTSTADTAALVIAAGATYDIYDTQSISGAGAASIANAGLFADVSHNGGNPSSVAAAFSNTGSVSVTGNGVLLFSGAFANTGKITVSDGSLSVSQAATGSGGTIDIGTGGVVAFATAVAGQSFAFTGTGATLDLGDPNGTTGAITGFAAGDTIDLTGIRANGFSYVGSTLTLTQTNNGTVQVPSYTLDLPGVTGTLAIANDANGGTEVVLDHTGPVFTSNTGTVFSSTWTVDGSGAWTTGGDWATQVGPAFTIEPVVPTAQDNVALTPGGTADFTVTYADTDTVNSLEGAAQATLAMTSGTLTVNGGGVLNGAATQAAGVSLDAVSGLVIAGGFTQAGGAIDEVDSESLAVGSGTLAGTVDGSGNFYLIGGSTVTIEPGFTNSAAGFELGVTTNGFGSMTTLDTDLAYAHRFLLDNVSGNPASLDLNGHTLTLSGTAGLYGLINGPGTVALTGSAELSGVDLFAGMLFRDSGSVVQDSVIVLGDSTADTSAIDIAAGATWDLTSPNGVNAAGNVSIENAGLFEKTASTGVAFIGPNFDTTGTVLVATGVLALNGLNSSLGGTIEGAGDLVLRGPGNYTIEPGVALTVATLDLALGGDADNSFTTLDTNLTYNGHFSVDNVSGNPAFLLLNSHTLTLTGPTALNGVVEGAATLQPGGTMVLAGNASMGAFQIIDNAVVSITGTVTEDNVNVLGLGTADTSAIDIAAGGTYDLVADTGINASGSVAVNNAGLFEKTAGTGISFIDPNFDTTGTVLVATGALALNGLNSSLGGTIEGAGDLILRGPGSYTIEPGVALTVATLDLALGGDADNSFTTLDTNLTYNGHFSVDNVSGNPAFLLLNSHTLTLTGPTSLNGVVEGAATLQPSGTMVLAGNAEMGAFQIIDNAVVSVTGTVAEDNLNILGLGTADTSAIDIAAGATYDLIADTGINASDTLVSVNNAGLFEKTVGGGNGSRIDANFINTGTIAVDTGTLILASGQFGGTIAGAGTLIVGGAGTFDAGLDLAVGAVVLQNGTVTMQAALDYARPFTLNGAVMLLGGNNLTLTGTAALSGQILDAGTVSVSNGDVNQLTLGGGLLLQDAGTIVETGFVNFGTTSTDISTLDIGAGKLWHIINNGGFGGQGTAEISNSGTILRDGAAGTDIFFGALVNTGTVDFETGFNLFGNATTNDNQMMVANGTLQIEQPFTAGVGRTGTVTIGQYGTLTDTGSIDTSQVIDFATAGAPTPQDGAGMLALHGGFETGGFFQASITNFAEGDTIDLGAIASSLGSPSPGVVSVINSGTTIGDISLTEAHGAGVLALVQNGLNDTLLEVACFAAGTRILTTAGEVAVEELAAGAAVPTLLGGGVRRVVWVGSTVIDLDRHPAPEHAAPVQIQAHAFGPGVPQRDLLLSPDHAVCVDGSLVPIHLLLNGASIRREPATGCVRYFHVELDRHEVLLAEGLPAESYLDTGNRALFSGAAGARELHPDLCAALSARAWDERACAVLQLGGAAVRAAHARLLRRAATLGHCRTDAPGLRVSVDGRPIACAPTMSNRVRIELPPGAREVRIGSRSSVPSELDAAAADRRRLGVPIAAVRRDGRALALHGPAFALGFYPMAPGESWRWTNGAAVLRLRPLPRASVLELRLVGGWFSYWAEAAGPRAAATSITSA